MVHGKSLGPLGTTAASCRVFCGCLPISPSLQLCLRSAWHALAVVAARTEGSYCMFRKVGCFLQYVSQGLKEAIVCSEIVVVILKSWELLKV